MARIRAIKPDFWLDEEIASWPHVTRLAYIGLWNEADDEGRLRANPAYLKNRIFPYEPKLDIESVLRPIIAAEKLVIYTVGAQTYGFLPKFKDHQIINRPSPSKLPSLTEGSLRTHGGLTEDSLKTHAGKEGKGRERKGQEGGGCGAGVSAHGTVDDPPAKTREAAPHVAIFEQEARAVGLTPVVAGPDAIQLAEARKKFPDDDGYRAALRRYFGMQDKFLVENRWAGRFIGSRLQALLNPTKTTDTAFPPAKAIGTKYANTPTVRL